MTVTNIHNAIPLEGTNEHMQNDIDSTLIDKRVMPDAKRVRTTHQLHDDERHDDYHWLRDKENPEVIEFLNEWNTYTEEQIAPLEALSNKLYSECIGRIAMNDKSAPYQVGEYLYYTRKEEGKEYPIYCQVNALSNSPIEEIILDGNEVSKQFSYFKVKNYKPSPDGKCVAFMIDTEGTQYGKLYVVDMTTNEFIKDEVIENSSGSIVWNDLSTGFWYVQVNEQKRSDKLKYHMMGTNPSEDPTLHHEEDTLFDIGIHKDKLSTTLFVTSESKDSTEVRIANLNLHDTPLKLIAEKTDHFIYNVIPGNETHYLLVTEGNKNAALMETKSNSLEKDEWNMLIPSNPDREIEEVTVMKNHIAMVIRENGLMKIEIRSLKDQSTHTVQLPQEICEVYFGHNGTYDTNKLRFIFNSPVNPETTYLYDMDSRELEVIKKEFSGDFDPSKYTTERIWAPANDGTKIPITLFYQKGIKEKGPIPMYLYGYGSYGITIDPYFSRTTASLLERGVCCAIAHIRGSGYLGRNWYEQGKMDKKMNTFTDFINSAEYLINKGITSSDKLVIRGGSAGGLLMGAVINMRPDLFKACVALVPFVDVVTTMLDEDLPLTTQEWIEWGNPNKKEDYFYMKGYSPVDNVRAQNYPSLYVKAGLNDAQVSYHEPAKWVAKLREFKTDSNPLLFTTNMKAGHHGSSGRFAAYKECAPYFAFMLDQLGIKE